MTGLFELSCPRCGGKLSLSGGVYECDCCGKQFTREKTDNAADALRSVLDEQKQEALANLRRQLWAEMHAQYINSARVCEIARNIKNYLPEDYFANFCDVANDGSDAQINAFLNATTPEQLADYADTVLDFMLKSAKPANLAAVSLFIERAYKDNPTLYDMYATAYDAMAEQVNSGVYELILPRDVFLAYSSADIAKVIELCDYLESNNISCFMAIRNLRHGRGAADNYEKALKTAMDNCKTVVFVSSARSRSMTCDAFTKELPYVKQKDLEGAPAEFKYAYDKLPPEYMMPRVEYLIEDYRGDFTERVVKEFFHGLEWCKSVEAVANRITKYLTEQVGETYRQKSEREARELKEKLDEERRKAEEQRLAAERENLQLKQRIAEEQRLAAEAASANAQQPQAAVGATEKTLLMRALQELESGDYARATEYYNKVLDINPTCGAAWLGLYYAEMEVTEFEAIGFWESFSKEEEYLPRLIANYNVIKTFKGKNLTNAEKYGDENLKDVVIACGKDWTEDSYNQAQGAIFGQMLKWADAALARGAFVDALRYYRHAAKREGTYDFSHQYCGGVHEGYTQIKHEANFRSILASNSVKSFDELLKSLTLTTWKNVSSNPYIPKEEAYAECTPKFVEEVKAFKKALQDRLEELNAEAERRKEAAAKKKAEDAEAARLNKIEELKKQIVAKEGKIKTHRQSEDEREDKIVGLEAKLDVEYRLLGRLPNLKPRKIVYGWKLFGIGYGILFVLIMIAAGVTGAMYGESDPALDDLISNYLAYIAVFVGIFGAIAYAIIFKWILPKVNVNYNFNLEFKKKKWEQGQQKIKGIEKQINALKNADYNAKIAKLESEIKQIEGELEALENNN